jgi:hypothetical protein
MLHLSTTLFVLSFHTCRKILAKTNKGNMCNKLATTTFIPFLKNREDFFYGCRFHAIFYLLTVVNSLNQ